MIRLKSASNLLQSLPSIMGTMSNNDAFKISIHPRIFFSPHKFLHSNLFNKLLIFRSLSFGKQAEECEDINTSCHQSDGADCSVGLLWHSFSIAQQGYKMLTVVDQQVIGYFLPNSELWPLYHLLHRKRRVCCVVLVIYSVCVISHNILQKLHFHQGLCAEHGLSTCKWWANAIYRCNVDHVAITQVQCPVLIARTEHFNQVSWVWVVRIGQTEAIIYRHLGDWSPDTEALKLAVTDTQIACSQLSSSPVPAWFLSPSNRDLPETNFCGNRLCHARCYSFKDGLSCAESRNV